MQPSFIRQRERQALCAGGVASWSLVAALAAVVALWPSAARAEGMPHASPDPSFRWEAVSSAAVPGGTITTVRLVSQTWQGTTWTHWLRVIEPEELTHPEAAVLIIAGGRNREAAPGALRGEAQMLPLFAMQTGSRVVLLEQVPNQPLLGGLREDALIAHSFRRYLETGDSSWPALVPMTRSAIRAMDAVQALTAAGGRGRVERFFVTGASKRGWTTWLTAAADPRVMGIAPMVIDVLNMKEQMRHQVASFGDYSAKIGDYTRLGLPQKIETEAADNLLALIDPWRHRAALIMPKLIVLGTNDAYWPVDAIQHYFDDLPGEKHIHYVPNAGHKLGPSAIESTALFYRRLLEGKPLPRYAWTSRRSAAGAGGDLELDVSAEDRPAEVVLFTATAPTRDFRKASWSDRIVAAGEGGHWLARVPEPKHGFTASFVMLVYPDPISGRSLRLCTPITVIGDTRTASF